MSEASLADFSHDAMFVIATSPVGIIMNVYSFYVFSNMVKNHFSSNPIRGVTAEVSPCMLIYIILEAVYSLNSIFYFAYLILDSLIGRGYTYHAYYLWGFAATLSMCMESLPVAVTFLSIERCFGIIVPFYMKKSRKRKLGYISFAVLFLLAAILGVIHIAAAFPPAAITECKGFGCLCKPIGQSFYAIERLTVGVVNTILLIVLAIFIKNKLMLPGLARKTNLIVLKTLGILLILDFTPHLVWYVMFTFFGINLTKPYGPFFILAALDAYLCSRVFRKQAKHEDAHIQPITLPTVS